MILLITKYNLSSRWLHLFTFLILYLICLKLHYTDLNNNNFVECMMKSSPEIKSEIPNKNLFPEGLRQHAVVLSPEELSARINDNVKQINENVGLFNKVEQVLIEAEQKMVAHKSQHTHDNVRLSQQIKSLKGVLETRQTVLLNNLNDLNYARTEQAIRTIEELKATMLEADSKSEHSNNATEALPMTNYATLEQFYQLEQRFSNYLKNHAAETIASPTSAHTQCVETQTEAPVNFANASIFDSYFNMFERNVMDLDNKLTKRIDDMEKGQAGIGNLSQNKDDNQYMQENVPKTLDNPLCKKAVKSLGIIGLGAFGAWIVSLIS